MTASELDPEKVAELERVASHPLVVRLALTVVSGGA
jgi:hypothetical protein